MIIIPNSRPLLLKKMETDFASSIAAGIWIRIHQQLNWINAAVPIGFVMYFYQSQTFANGSQIPQPNANWKYMDGTAVSDPLSPLNGVTLPDLRSKFAKAFSNIGSTGGQETIDLEHDHSGFTGETFDRENLKTTDNNNDVAGPNLHAHPIEPALGEISTIPPYIDVQPYMRIR